MPRLHASVVVFLTGAMAAVAPAREATRPELGSPVIAAAARAVVPVPLVENRGQWPEAILFAGRTGPWTLQLREAGWDLLVRDAPAMVSSGTNPALLQMRWEGSSPECVLEPERRLPGVHHFLRGCDPRHWRRRVSGYGSVRFLGLYPGIDVRMRFEAGRPEYDLLVAPGADLSRARLRVLGVDSMTLEEDGSLLLATAIGPVRQPPPVAWVEGAAGRQIIPVHYRLLGPDRFGFAAPGWDQSEPLLIDPWFEYATFIGAADFEAAYAVAIDQAGLVTVAGEVESLGFPVTPGAAGSAYRGASDAFVARFDATGSKLLFATYLGGSGYDAAYALGLDSTGATLLGGYTDSTDFPTTSGAFDTAYNGGGDGFVARLAPNGDALLYATFLGGPGFDAVTALHADGQGVVSVAGFTDTQGFPVTPGAFSVNHKGGNEAFVARLDSLGATLVFSTLLGGSGSDQAWGIDVDRQGRVTVAGDTDSIDFPTTPGAYRTRHNGSGRYDTFVARLDGTGSTLHWATFLGGDGDEFNYGMKLDDLGRVYVAGTTDSDDFPATPGAWSTRLGGYLDAYVACLDPSGAALVWATYLGGSGYDFANALDVDPGSGVIVAGETESLDFPTTPGAPARRHQGGLTDAFLVRFGPSGERLTFATFLGGSNYDSAWAVASDRNNRAALAGVSFSTNMPVTPNSFAPLNAGRGDAWVARLLLELPGVVRYGSSVPACLGQPTAFALEAARPGNQNFGLACTGAPPSTAGVLLVGVDSVRSALPLLGSELWVDLTQLFVPLVVASDRTGEATVPAPLPVGTAGARLFVQFLWFNTVSCGGAGPLSSSDALELTL